jgi:CRISPR-associated RAMP protein (TIGR02581 family)
MFCQADITLELEPIDPVLVKSGYATIDGPDMVPVRTYRNGESIVYFPGSSLKGVLRSHLERIARTLAPASVCIPYFDSRRDIPIPVAAEVNSFGCGYRSRGQPTKDSSSAAYNDSCAICRMFGSLKFGGRFSIGDAYPRANHAPAIEHRNGVGIDRFTGGSVSGVLFDLYAVVGGKFVTSIRLMNFELWQLAALNFLLIDMEDQLISIGSGRSRGLGRIRGTPTSYKLSYVHPTRQVDGLYQLTTNEERQSYGLHDWQPPTPISVTVAAVRGVRSSIDLSTDWKTILEPLLPSFESFLSQFGPLRGAPSRTPSEPAAL